MMIIERNTHTHAAVLRGGSLATWIWERSATLSRLVTVRHGCCSVLRQDTCICASAAMSAGVIHCIPTAPEAGGAHHMEITGTMWKQIKPHLRFWGGTAYLSFPTLSCLLPQRDIFMFHRNLLALAAILYACIGFYVTQSKQSYHRSSCFACWGFIFFFCLS